MAATITRYRGDTVADKVTVTDSAGVVVNITGFSFLLTVNKEKEPASTSNQLFQVAGVITNAPAGMVEFSPTANQANQVPGKYYYDVQMTDGAGRIQTILFGRYVIKQDITK